MKKHFFFLFLSVVWRFSNRPHAQPFTKLFHIGYTRERERERPTHYCPIIQWGTSAVVQHTQEHQVGVVSSQLLHVLLYYAGVHIVETIEGEEGQYKKSVEQLCRPPLSQNPSLLSLHMCCSLSLRNKLDRHYSSGDTFYIVAYVLHSP